MRVQTRQREGKGTRAASLRVVVCLGLALVACSAGLSAAQNAQRGEIVVAQNGPSGVQSVCSIAAAVWRWGREAQKAAAKDTAEAAGFPARGCTAQIRRSRKGPQCRPDPGRWRPHGTRCRRRVEIHTCAKTTDPCRSHYRGQGRLCRGRFAGLGDAGGFQDPGADVQAVVVMIGRIWVNPFPVNRLLNS